MSYKYHSWNEILNLLYSILLVCVILRKCSIKKRLYQKYQVGLSQPVKVVYIAPLGVFSKANRVCGKETKNTYKRPIRMLKN